MRALTRRSNSCQLAKVRFREQGLNVVVGSFPVVQLVLKPSRYPPPTLEIFQKLQRHREIVTGDLVSPADFRKTPSVSIDYQLRFLAQVHWWCNVKRALEDTLRKMADRIQARAIRRCGELAKKIEPSKGGRPPKTAVLAAGL